MLVSLLKDNGAVQYYTIEPLTTVAPVIAGIRVRLAGSQSSYQASHSAHFVNPGIADKSLYPSSQSSADVAIWTKNSAKKAKAIVFMLLI